MAREPSTTNSGTTPSSSKLSEAELAALSLLLPALQAVPNLPAARAVLTLLSQEGVVDPRKIYDVAAQTRPARWGPSPPWEAVNPEA